jgi:hypothetical protein
VISLREALESGSDGPETLERARISAAPTLLMLFDDSVENVALHYVYDEAVNSYVPCPGVGCPACFLGEAPHPTFLLPVLHLARRAVQVLLVSPKRGPGTLASGLLPHLEDPTGYADKVFAVTRNGGKFTVRVHALGERADRCVSVVAGFVKARAEGLSLLAAFPEYSAVEFSEIGTVRRGLDAVGGWVPPAGSTHA